MVWIQLKPLYQEFFFFHYSTTTKILFCRFYTACDSWDILKPSPTMDGSKTNNSKALHTNRCFHQSMSETFVNIIGWQWPITDRALIWNRLFSQHKKQKTILRELWNYVITWFVEQSISSSSVRNTLVLSCVYHMQCSAQLSRQKQCLHD